VSSVMLFALKVFSVMVLNHVKGIFKYFGNEALRVSSVMVFVNVYSESVLSDGVC
jgi:hypothetical protein